MFLVSVTKKSIINNIRNTEYSISERKINHHFVTLIADNNFSVLNEDEDNISLEEYLNIDGFNESLILAKSIINKKSGKLSVFKPTHSGRPIYYHINSSGDFFCSTHIKALRAAGVEIEENTKLLPEYFIYRYIMPPNTLFKNVMQLPIGSTIVIDIKNNNCEISSEQIYDPLVFDKTIQITSQIEEEITIISNDLTDSIKNLHALENNLSFLLSGGLDSSVLFQLGKNYFNIYRSYSTGYPFETPANNYEKYYALSAAKAFGSDHNYYEPTTNEYIYAFVRAIESAEEPVDHLQSVLLFLLFERAIPPENNIIISGEGADGIFGNEIQYLIFNSIKQGALKRIFSYSPLIITLEKISKIANRGYGFIERIKAFELTQKDLNDPDNIIYSVGKYGNEEWVRNYFSVKSEDIIKNRYNWVKKYKDHSIFNIITILNIFGGASITQSIWSKLSESKKLISYYPYFHQKLIENMLSINWENKLIRPKNILCKVAQNIGVPDFIIQRPKMGFGINPQKWAIPGGVFEYLIPAALKIFDEKTIRNFQSEEMSKAMILWNILNYSIWKRIFINNESIDTILADISID